MREAQRERGIMLTDNGYWLYCDTNGGFRDQAALGKFYFNLKPEMVVYFDAEEEQEILQVLENLYRSNPEAFDETGTPRFTAEVKNQRGEK